MAATRTINNPGDTGPAAALTGAHASCASTALLLVDDDPFMLEMQATMLRGMGYAPVDTAASAEGALHRLAHGTLLPDVIVCDLNMPGMDGIEFLQKLSTTPFSGNVILVSGEGARIMHAVQKMMGGSDLVILGALEKPASREALRTLLECRRSRSGVPQRGRALSFTGAQLNAANLHREWVLHYQPKVSLRTGALAGMEALVRWDHPVHGLVYPDSFIHTAEECGAIDGLTAWVLQEAMAQQMRWQDAGLALKMAVNISMENLRTPGFAGQVVGWARRSGAAPKNLMLEVTESRLMSPSPVPLESLVRLRMQRFGLSIDDFGTGHSSLAQLRDIPFTELKIDRGFVQGARHNQIIRPILEGSVGIAKRLDMEAVAEGIETEDDWHLMREIGCDFGQGWFIGRPMVEPLVPTWVEMWQSRRAALTRS